MIFGYPGSTDRYLTSWGIQEALEETNPTIIKIRDHKLDVMKQHMDADPAIRIKYASKYAQTANYWKYFIGQSKGLKRLHVYEKKKELETAFAKWVSESPERMAKYGEALSLIESAYKDNRKINKNRWYINEAIFRGAEVFFFCL